MSASPVLAARELCVERRSRDARFALEVGALELHAGEVLAILGPNGAGKSTLLRALAGLESPTRGGVERRAEPVTMVFQRPIALAGSVAHNVRSAFLGRGLASGHVRAQVASALERFGIAALAGRAAHSLSGGELRRLALARAFALRPAALLLDEPFDDLDAAGQASLSLDLGRAITDTGVAVAVVTHDLRRALLLGDRIAVLLRGQLAQQGERDEVLRRPRTPEIARLVGMSNLIAGVVAGEATERGIVVEVDPQHRIPATGKLPAGTPVWAGIRPEHLKLDVGRGEGEPIGKGVARNIVDDGVAATVSIEWAGSALRTHLLAGRGLARTLRSGDPVSLSVRPEDVHVLPRQLDPGPAARGSDG